jgi:glutathione-regulated potassium-efflux system ancillary protein KefG
LTVGAPREAYRAGGFNRFTLDDLPRPFQQAAYYVKAKYFPAMAIYDSVFLDQPALEAAVCVACQQIVRHQENPAGQYEPLLQKAETAEIALPDLAAQSQGRTAFEEA